MITEMSGSFTISGTSEREPAKHINPKFIIGIDPDIHESGFAVWNKKRKCLVACDSFKFFDLKRELKFYDDNFQTTLEAYIIHIEGGWLVDKSNFHRGGAANVRERIAKNVGSNHEAGRKIVEMCIEHDFPFIVRRPIAPKFADERIFKMITKWPLRTNIDSRSAANYVYGY